MTACSQGRVWVQVDRHAGGFGVEYYHPVSYSFVNRHRSTACKHGLNLNISSEKRRKKSPSGVNRN